MVNGNRGVAPARSMWRFLLAACAAAIFWAASVAAKEYQRLAVDVEFTGQYLASACYVKPGVDKIFVQLPAVSTLVLKVEGATAGTTSFVIPLVCDPGAENVRAFFEYGATVDPVRGTLVPQAPPNGGAAGNVHVQLLRPTGQPIKVGNRDTMPLTPLNGQSEIDLRYSVQYLSLGNATVGEVVTSVTYVIEMQ